MRPVQPGDLLLLDTRYDLYLTGIVLKHHNELSQVADQVPFLELIKGPGVVIYWITSDCIAHWDYDRISKSLNDGSLQILARSPSRRSRAGRTDLG